MSEGLVVASWGLYTSIAAHRCQIVASAGYIVLTLEVTRVRDDDGARLLEVVERGGHGGWWYG